MRMTFMNPWASWFDLARTHQAMWETFAGSQTVLAARIPSLMTAASSPLSADHAELSLMVSEKVEAFGQTGRRGARGARRINAAAGANARDFRRMADGAVFGPFDWWRIAERNMAIANEMMALPAAMLAPIHKTVTSNAKRLNKVNSKD